MMQRTLRLSELGGIISFLEAGQGAPVVLIHGVGMRAAAWGPQIEALSQSHHIIAVDMPGHGGSVPLPQGALLSDFVDWLHRVTAALGCGPANIVGHSMGSLIAAGYAITHPAETLRVAVLNGVYRRTDAARLAVRARADDIACGMFDLEGPLNRWFGDSAAERSIRDLTAGWLAEVNHDAYAAAYRAFAPGDAVYADRWHEIACPALVLTGADDQNSTAEMARAMAAQAVRGVACIIPGHRHMVNLTAPDAVNLALSDWLAMPADPPRPDALRQKEART